MKNFKEFVKDQLNESIDPHAAVLIAHVEKAHPAAILDAAGKIRGYGKKLSVEDVKKFIELNKLKLRSSSPDALKNLHSNLLKINK